MDNAKAPHANVVQSWKEAFANGTADARCDELIARRHAKGEVPKALAKLVEKR